MEQHIANTINHCVMTGEEGLGPTSLNTKQVGAALREVFPSQAALGLDLLLGRDMCHAEHALGTCAVTRFTFGVQGAHCTRRGAACTLRPVCQRCNALAPGTAGRSRGATGIFSAVRGCAKQARKQEQGSVRQNKPCSTCHIVLHAPQPDTVLE